MVRPFHAESPLLEHRPSNTNQNDPDYYLTCACVELFLAFVRGVPNAIQPRASDERTTKYHNDSDPIPEYRTNYSPRASLVLTRLLLGPHSEIINVLCGRCVMPQMREIPLLLILMLIFRPKVQGPALDRRGGSQEECWLPRTSGSPIPFLLPLQASAESVPGRRSLDNVTCWRSGKGA